MTPLPGPHMRNDQPLLVLNCGSSSIKFALFQAGAGALPRRPWCNGKVQGIGGPDADFGARGIAVRPVRLDPAHPYRDALRLILEHVQQQLHGRAPLLVAHRVVHGGSRHFTAVRIDAALLAELHGYIPLAPLHQPFALEAIQILLQHYPQVPQVACFDTGFHHDLPTVEQLLPLPYAWFERGLRRYGFHGLSYSYLAIAVAERHGQIARGRTIVAHLGSGASLCALHNLRSVATTMGFSALDGLMMGTRSGAIDPGVLLYLMEVEKIGPAELGQLLYHQSGLIGVSGLSADPRVLLQHEHDPGQRGEQARLALALYVQRIIAEIGSLTARLGGLDLLVFSAGIGEHNAPIRERICAGLAFLGVKLDAQANTRHAPLISRADSAVVVGVEPTNEEWIAVRDGWALVTGQAVAQ